MVVLPVLIRPAIVCRQVFNWLRTAKWQPISVSDALDFSGIPHPTFGWLGLQKMSDAILDWPLSIFAFVVWLTAFCFWLAYFDEAAKKKRAKR
jgi:hypothetical protein